MENEYTGKTLEELSVLIHGYLNRYHNTGGISEFDLSINDISRAVIQKYKEKHGKCFLGRINDYDCDRKNPDIRLAEYTGQMIPNFRYEFILPCDDEDITRLINEYNREKEYPNPVRVKNLIGRITRRIVELEGDFLIWG